MADPVGPTADNLKIAQQLLAAMSQISTQLENQTRAYRAQAELADALCKAQDCFAKIDGSKVQAISDGLKTAQENTKSFSDELVNSEAEAEKLRSKTAEVASEARNVVIADEFKNGLKAGLNLTKALLGSLLRIGSAGLSGIVGIGKALLSIPGNILSFFQDNAVTGTDPWREALEELRDTFGSLEVGTSKAVLGMMDNVHQFNDSGLQLGRVFGYGRAGAALAMKEFMKIAAEMGPMGMRFMDATKGVSGQLLILTKSTGLTGDALRTLQISADNGGDSVASAVQKMSVALARAQKTFGISVKEMGKDMEVMMKDVGTFGVMSTNTMIKTSVYARKLGVSMESLKKIMDKTLNFEDTANMAGGLAEAFNMNIDAMKMMKAQTPVEKLDQLREAFFRTGKNIDQMSIAERKHLSNLTNLSEEELRIAFAQKNRALSGAAVDAQMKKSQKTQMTQEEAMHELSGSIKKLVQAGSAMKGGFFETFFSGFDIGMKRTREFRRVAREVQQDMRIIKRAGIEVGQMFIHYFPGMRDMLNALGDMFNPAKFRRLMNRVKMIFAVFFIDLQRDPKAGVQNFMKNMKKAFFDFFDSGSGAGSRFLGGMQKFWKAFGAIAIEGLRFGIESIRDAAKGITGFLKNPRSFMEGASKAGSGISGALAQAFSYAVKELLPVIKEAAGAVGEMLKTAFTEYVVPFLRRHAILIGSVLFGVLFGPAFLRAGMAALLSGGGGIFRAISGGVARLFSGAGGVGGGGGGGGAAAMSAQQAEEQRSIGGSLKNTLKDFAKSASGILLAVLALKLILWLLMPEFMKLVLFVKENSVSAGDVLIALLAVGGVAMLFVGLQKIGFFESMKLLYKSLEGNLKEIGLGVVAALVTLAIIGAAAVVTIETFSVYSESQVKNAMNAMYSMTGLFYAMMPLLVVAGLLGTAILLTGGGAALAAATGLAAVGVALAAMAAETVSIIKMFVGIPKEQADIAISSMKEVTNLYKVVADSMLKMALLSILRPRTIISIIEKITLLVRQISISVIDIIRSINLNGDINLLKAKAEVFSAALRGVGSIITPITNFGTALAENDSIFDSGAMKRIVTELSILMTAMFTGIEKIIRQIGNLNLGDDPNGLKAKAEVFTVVLTGIAAIITPITNFGIAVSNSAGGFFSSSAEVVRSMTELGITMPIVLRSIGTLATTLLKSMSEISSTVDPVKLKSVAEILISTLKGVIEIVAALLGMFSGSENTRKYMAIGGLVGSLAGPVAAAFGSVIGGIAGAKIDQREFQTKIDGIRLIFEMLKTNLKDIISAITVPITEILKLPNLTTDSMKAVAAFGDIMKGVGSILAGVGSAASALPRPMPNPNDLGPVGKLLEAISPFIKNILDNVKKVMEDFSHFDTGQIKNLIDLSPIISSIFTFMSNFSTIITNGIELMRGKNPEEMGRIGNTLVHFINTISNQTQNLMRQIPEIVRAVSSIDLSGIDPVALAAKVTSVKAVLDLVGSISTATKGIQDVAQTHVGAGATDMAIYTVMPIVSLLLTMFAEGSQGGGIIGLGGALRNGLKALSEFIFPANLNAQVASMQSLFQTIKSISEAATALSTLGGAGAQAPMRADVMNIPLSNLAILLTGLNSDYVFINGSNWMNPLTSPGIYFDPLVLMSSSLRGKGTLLTSIKNIVVELLSSANAIIPALNTNTTALAAEVLNLPLSNLAILINSLKSDYVFINGSNWMNPLTSPEIYFGPLPNILRGITGKGALLTSIKNIVVELLSSANAIIPALNTNTTALAADVLNLPLGNLAILINSLKSDHVLVGGVEYDNPLHNPRIYFGSLPSILRGITGKGALLTSIKNEVIVLLDSARGIAEIPRPAAALATDVLNLPLGNLAVMINSLKSDHVLVGGVEYDNPLHNPRIYFGPLGALLEGITGKGVLLTNIKNELIVLLNSAGRIAEIPRPAAALATDVLNLPLGNLAVMINSLKSEHVRAGGVEYDNPLHNPRIYFGPLGALLEGITGKGVLLTNIKNEVTMLLNSAKAIADQPIVPYNQDLGASLANMTSVLEIIDSYFAPGDDLQSITHLVENIYNNTRGRVSHDLSAVVRHYNALSRDLAAMEAIDIDTSLTRLNSGLGSNRIVQVEHAAANISIQLNVAITAQSIEDALYDRIDQRYKNRPGGFKADAMTARTGDLQYTLGLPG